MGLGRLFIALGMALMVMTEASAIDFLHGQGPVSNVYIAEWSKLRHSADMGDVNAQFQLPNFYYEPPEHSSLPKSYLKAAKYYRLAAEQNHAPSQHNLGVLLLKGQGVERDWVEAYAWFSLAADQGYRAAQDAIAALTPRLNDAEKQRAEQLKNGFKTRMH